jgi:hypothetical protein
MGVGRGSDLLDCGTRERLLVARQGMSASSQRQKQRQEGKVALHAGIFYREYGTQELRKLKLRDGFAISFGTSLFEVGEKEDRWKSGNQEIRNGRTFKSFSGCGVLSDSAVRWVFMPQFMHRFFDANSSKRWWRTCGAIRFARTLPPPFSRT